INIENIHFCTNSYQSLDEFIKGNYKYDIVIFDEAHNFRNTNTLRYLKAKELCAGKQVLLIGATPINNGIDDLEAQLMLGLNSNTEYDFGVGTLGEFFDRLKSEAGKSKKNTKEYKEKQKIAGNKIREIIISKLMVRRTRQDILKYYKNDIENNGFRFPTVDKPVLVKYKYPDVKLGTTLDILSGYNYKYKLTYALYNGRYLNSDANKAQSMVGLNKVRLIKMLDSSPQAFIGSLYNMLEKTKSALNSAETFVKETQAVGFEQYIADLKNDETVIKYLMQLWYVDDILNIKLNKLLEIVEKHRDSKIVIFTEFISTANAIYEKLSDAGYSVLEVTGKTSHKYDDIIKDNFGIYGNTSDNYDILISTNVLSEGVNLNRADVAINYDITWNPMTVIQRVGRLDRIDSKVDTIKVYNFFPCDEMDSAILSESNIISKFALASYSIGMDENYLTDNNDDINETLLEQKNTIVNSIQNSLVDDNYSFKTVEFKYSNLANNIFSDVETIESLPKEVIINRVKSTTQPSVSCLMSVNGKLLACVYDSSGIRYIDYNNFLDLMHRHKDIVIVDNSFNFEALNKLVEFVRSNYSGLNKITSETKAFYVIVDKLDETAERLLLRQEIDEFRYNEIINKLNKIKFNIINGYIDSYLCNEYKKQYIELISNVSDEKEQLNIFFNSLMPLRFYDKINDNTITSVKIISAVEFYN
ncbi:MAG: DEAD/DEAH box helicase, partial [Lachnospiraceae bacterium]|nr:DEAD/DEAH box helicase [Lachnospiraceae bacterium]